MKNPTGLCMCGCGERTDPAPTTRRGYRRGEPLCFIKGHSSRALGEDFVVQQRGFETPCWIWAKSVGSEGYGRIWNNSRQGHEMAHRVFYEKYVGPIPSDHDVHHRCGQRACVNPAHLEPLTRREHMAAEGRPAYGNPKAVLHV